MSCEIYRFTQNKVCLILRILYDKVKWIFAGGEALADVWVFMVGSVLGAVLAAIAFQIFKAKKAK